MKIRKGFVTNSSSSSFIIASKKKLPPKIISSIYEHKDGIKTEKQLLDFFIEMSYCDNYNLATYIKILQYMKEHPEETIYHCVVDWDNKSEWMKDLGDIQIVEDLT